MKTPTKFWQIRTEAETDDVYREHIANARIIDIVGIACSRFIENTYPGFEEGSQNSKDSASRRLGRSTNGLLAQLKRRQLNVHVRMMDPWSEFIEGRSQEEGERNCRKNIISKLETMKCLANDLKSALWSTKRGSSFVVSLIDKNPYFSIFRAIYEEDKRRANESHAAYLGFIAHGSLGRDCPMLELNPMPQIQADFIGKHLSALDSSSRVLFKWEERNVEFMEYRTDYDVFLCHNSRDKEPVREIAAWLRRNGLRSWLDESEISPGADWKMELHKAIDGVKCAAVFLGPAGAGKWQVHEISILSHLAGRGGLRVIPVLLPGAAEPTWFRGLPSNQWVDLKKGDEQKKAKLLEAILDANNLPHPR